MSEEEAVTDTEKVESVEPEEVESEEVEHQEPEDVDSDPDGGGDDDGEEEEVFELNGKEIPAPEKAPDWVREVRKKNRESEKVIAALKRENEALKAPKADKKQSQKPVIADFAYDEDKYAVALESYLSDQLIEKQQAELEVNNKKAQQEAWDGRLSSYEEQKASIGDAAEDAEEIVVAELSEQQQSVIIHASDAPAQVVYALGNDPALLKRLSGISDPIRLAVEIGKIEGGIKVSKRKRKAPPPERKVNSGSGGNVDNQLDRLREEASRTGNFTKVNAYRRSQRNN